MSDFGGLASALSAVAAMIAAGLMLVQSRAMRQGQEATLYLDFARRYASDEMRDAMNVLLDWRRDHPGDFAAAWRAALDAGDARATQVNQARRTVHRHFLDIVQMRQVGVISARVARLLTGVHGLTVYYRIVEPLNLAVGTASEAYRQQAKQLRAIRRRYADDVLLDHF